MNDPGFGDPFVIDTSVGTILSFDFDFAEPVGNDDEFGAFVLNSSGVSAGPAFEFFIQSTGSGSISFDIASLAGEPFLGLQFQLSRLFGDSDFSSVLTVSNVQLNTALPTPIPEPSSLALLATGGIGLIAYRRRKRKQAA